MDTIEDTYEALSEYLKLPPKFHPRESGYIYVYGVLQALYVQQEAVEHLCMSLKIPFDRSNKLKEIMSVRNDVVGHPTDRKKGKKKIFVMLNRMSIEKRGFRYMQLSDDSPSQYEFVDLESAVQFQMSEIEKEDIRITKLIEEKDEMHSKQYRDVKLASIFNNCKYSLDNLQECVNNPDRPDLSSILNESYKKFVKAMQERLEWSDMLHEKFWTLQWSLDWIDGYLATRPNLGINDPLPSIVAYYITHKFPELLVIAIDIDREYELK